MLSVGRRHACFLDRERRAHCWGFNVDGETGTGTAGIEAAMIAAPTPVVGDHRFQSLSAGEPADSDRGRLASPAVSRSMASPSAGDRTSTA
jgi:hypothetical protein